MHRSTPHCSPAGDPSSGNVEPLLNEVRHALERLIETGEPTSIDLRAIPLGPGEEERIETQLGKGEVEIHIEAMGPSHIFETRLAGVWLVTHYNTEREVLGKFIEISRMPEIAMSPDEDMRESLQTLSAPLNPLESTWRKA